MASALADCRLARMRSLLRALVILLNGALLILLVATMPSKGLPSPDDPGFVLVIVALIAPLVTLLYVIQSPDAGSSNFVSLWLRRKAAEERKKLQELEGDISSRPKQ